MTTLLRFTRAHGVLIPSALLLGLVALPLLVGGRKESFELALQTPFLLLGNRKMLVDCVDLRRDTFREHLKGPDFVVELLFLLLGCFDLSDLAVVLSLLLRNCGLQVFELELVLAEHDPDLLVVNPVNLLGLLVVLVDLLDLQLLLVDLSLQALVAEQLDILGLDFAMSLHEQLPDDKLALAYLADLSHFLFPGARELPELIIALRADGQGAEFASRDGQIGGYATYQYLTSF